MKLPTNTPISFKFQIKYDKLNTKYNRLWEQCTNTSFFILASIIAYSIAYLQFKTENQTIIIFLSNIILPVTLIAIPVLLVFGGFL
ncbi:MAG: hypothetical protein AABW67_06425, partial [Nanoarchaeota archaeon]